MERKTMGSFISALRKAQGLTQRELAERLNVSDKAVSRWERDESAPDLSLIPVIAEIFGVTADELLRGERADPAAGNPARGAEKREREIRRLARSVSTGFRIQSIISAGIALAGLVAAMILNFGFLRAYAGFFAACVFFIAAAVCEGAFLLRSRFALADSLDDEAVSRCRSALTVTAELVFSFILVLFAAALPLILLAPYAEVGLTGETWLKYALPAAAAGALLCFVFCLLMQLVHAVQRKDSRKGWLLKTSLITAAALLLTLVLHLALCSNFMRYTEGIEFQDFSKFINYMETILPDPEGRYYYEMPDYCLDEDENRISRSAYLTETVCSPSGQALFSYLNKNMDVAGISYHWKGDTLLEIKVCTWAQAEEAKAVMQKVSAAFYAFYALELGASLLLFFRRKKK